MTTTRQSLRYSLFAAMVWLVFACGGGGGSSDGDSPSGSTPQNPINTADGVANVVARTGGIVKVQMGETAALDGSKSFTSSDQPLTYQWSFSSKPHKSAAVLQDATTDNPSFIADEPGVYIAELIVSAEGVSSRRAVEQVVAVTTSAELAFHQGLSSDCVTCHEEGTGVAGAFPKKALHIASSDTCATCHIASRDGFIAVHYVDHAEIFGGCSECHNGVLAVGKSEFHIPTQAECDDCHNTTSFLTLLPDGSFDHSTIVRACKGCHNGTVAVGKTPAPPHPDTQSDCSACHSTDTFTAPYPDHTGPEVVGNRCDSCHGITASGPPAGHPTPMVDCASCHGIVTFSLGGAFSHRIDPSLQPCESCHNDNNSVNAPGKGSAVPSHPMTSEDCGVCHNTDSFADATFDHTGIVDDCASCHGVSATGKHANHMPTTEDCSVCHTPGTFATGTYDHAGVLDNCEGCHNNVITLGKLPNHLPTTQDCVVCHTTADFSSATFDHQGIDVNDCASCHNGAIALGKHNGHVPTALDCSACHTINNFTTFAGIQYDHQGIDPNDCASCHATGVSTPKPIDHIPTQDDCSVCHDSTDVFASNTFLVAVHMDISRGCEGCHNSSFFGPAENLTKDAAHLPTAQDCYLCHMNTAFTPSTFAHVDISNNCASCHDGSANFVSLGALGKTDTPTHNGTNADCSVCHDTTSFADAFVDHTSPEVLNARCDSCHNGTDAIGKHANHVPTTEDCGTCHQAGGAFVPANFDHTGIVDNCTSCHNGTDATGKDAKVNPPHIPTSQDCSVCHTTTAFANAFFDHQNIVDNCESCHNGTTAIGKDANHVPTNTDCVDCHQTTGFVPAAFDHTGIVDNCASCHDAGFAVGKPSDHLPTNQDCGVCHTTTTFIGAGFDHTGIVDNCESCHDGSTAVGKHADHIDTSLDCHNCHTTAIFVGGTWVHDASTAGRCDDCHSSGGGATFKPQNHLATTAQCDQCHVTTGWAPTNFSHDPNGNYPGDHRRDPGCVECHGATISSTIPYPYPQYAPFCAACHANEFERKDRHIGGENGTIEQNKDCSGGGQGCHRVTQSEF